MSFFGNNSSRPATGRNQDDDEQGVRSDTTFLGDASQALGSRTDTSRNLLDNEPRAPESLRPIDRSESGRGQQSSSGPTPPDRCANVIAAGAKWQGTLTVDDSVRIEGNFSGEVRSKGTVHVSEGAQVDAKIRGAYVVVSGNFRGEIRCDQRVDLLPQSRVNGEVITKILSIHEGAVLDGRVQMTQGAEAEATSTTSSSSRASREAERAERRQERAASVATSNDNSDQ